MRYSIEGEILTNIADALRDAADLVVPIKPENMASFIELNFASYPRPDDPVSDPGYVAGIVDHVLVVRSAFWAEVVDHVLYVRKVESV